jgi:hypothetical protein
MIPVDPTPKTERSTDDLRRELSERLASGDGCIGNRVQIALLRHELAARRERVAVVVTVAVEAHELDRGIWCGPCALPSVHRYAVVLAADPTVRLTNLMLCHDCGSWS